MPRIIISCFLLLLPFTAAAQTQQQRALQFAEYFHTILKQEKIPGGALAIVKRNEILKLDAYGHIDLKATQAVNFDTVFRLASVSKTFAAGLAGLVVDDGKLSWQDPITRYVPQFKIRGRTDTIQLGHILGQSTGLVPHAFDHMIEEGLAINNIYQKFRRLPLNCQPGACYGYQNTVFSLIEKALEKSTGNSYTDLLQQKIFTPLNMHNASIGYTHFVENPNHAKPHVWRRGSWQTVNVKPNYYRVPSAAGVNASITDMARWLMAQLGGAPTVLKPQVVRDITRPRIRTKRELGRRYWKSIVTNAFYGLGWRIYQLGDEEIVYHGGWVSGYRADIAYSKKHDLGVVILVNAETRSISLLSAMFWQMMLDK